MKEQRARLQKERWARAVLGLLLLDTMCHHPRLPLSHLFGFGEGPLALHHSL